MKAYYTFHQFNKLHQLQRHMLVDDKGEFLKVNRYEGRYQIGLFTLFNYYVEVWWDRVEDNVAKAVAFDSYKRLDLFLYEVDLTAISGLL